MRRLVVALGALAAMLAPVAISTPAHAAKADDAIADLGACLAGGGQGDLLVMMDTSASLADTDPQDQRVRAAGYLLQQLASFVEQTDASMDVAIAGFAHEFDLTRDWTALTGDSVASLVDSVNDYAAKKDGWETDYWLALNGARSALRDKAGAGDCQALVWFSDGMYDLDVRDTAGEQDAYGTRKPYGPDVELTTKAAEAEVEAAGITDLCRAGGVADALRAQGVATLAIGLQGGQEAGTFNLMRGVATGSKVNGAACGDQPASGAFVRAEGIGDLFFAFDALTDPDRAPITQTSPLCQGEVCAEGSHRFTVDPSISRVRVLGGADLTAYDVVLIAPDDSRLRFSAGEDANAPVSAGSAQATWLSDTVFSLRLDRTRDDGWNGAWQVVFVDPASTSKGEARTHIRLYGDLQPDWPDADDTQLVAGTRTDITLGLQRKDGTRVDPGDLPGVASIDATLVRQGQPDLELATDLDADDLDEPVSVDLAEVGPGPAQVQLALTYTTASAGDFPGTTLPPQAVAFPVTIAQPPDYPGLPASIDFGRGETGDPVTTSIQLDGDGCAWLESAEVRTLPDGVESALVESPSNAAAACKSGAFSLTLTPDAVGSGLLSGEVVLRTMPAAGNAEAITTRVPFTYEMQRPLNEPVFWVAFALILAAGLLIPLGLLMLVKWWNSRIPGSSLSLLSLKGPVHEHGSFLDVVVPDPGQIRNLPLGGSNGRRLPITGSASLETRPGYARFTEPGHVVVTGQEAVADTGKHLPIAVHGHWVALLDPADPVRGPVEVVLLLGHDSGSLHTLLDRARAEVPRGVNEHRARHHGAQAGSGPAAPSAPAQPSEWD